MAAPTVTASGDLSLPTGANTFRVESSNWEPQAEIQSYTNLDTFVQATPCVPAGLTFDPAAWLMTVGQQYNFTEVGPDGTPLPEPQELPRLTDLYLRGIMFLWDNPQGEPFPTEPPDAHFLGRVFTPRVWELGAQPESGARVLCARFALDIDKMSDTPVDAANTSLVFNPWPTKHYGVIILEAGARREASSSTSLSATASPTAVNSAAKKGSSNAGKIAAGVVVPLLVLLALGAAWFFWRRKRRERMAPSAAFRAQHPNGVSVTYATPPATAPLAAEGSELPTYANAAGSSTGAGPAMYFPTQEKRPFLYNQTRS